MKKDTTKQILTWLYPFKSLVVCSLFFALISVLLSLYVPILVGEGVDAIISEGKVIFPVVIQCIVKLLIVIGLTCVMQWCMGLCNNRITFGVIKNVRKEAFTKMQKLPLSYVDSHARGDLVSRMITDVEQVSDGLLLGFSQLFSGVFTILVTLIFMLIVQYKIALIVIVLTPLSLFIAQFIAKHTYELFKKQSEIRAKMTSFSNEMVGNHKVVQAFSYENRSMQEFDKMNAELEACSQAAVFYSSLPNPSTRFVNGIISLCVIVFGALSVLKGGMSIGQLVSFMQYANQYTKPFNEISNVITELQNALACVKRIMLFLEEEQEIKDTEEAVILSEVQGDVQMEGVAFSYQKDCPLLTDVNLNVEAGQKIAIVGPTGCGKTTLINLLMRFYTIDNGCISIDGVDTLLATKDSVREAYGMVLQETWLKSGTIYENIAYGKPNATKEEVMEAARKAYAASFIERLPKGYDTELSEEGNISEGERQLLCIARVMLLNPAMLILDEATSFIDTRTEIKIQKAFHSMMAKKTSFIVAHRLSTIRKADCILVMKDGNIIEKGNHEQLLKQKGFYAGLYESQG